MELVNQQVVELKKLWKNKRYVGERQCEKAFFVVLFDTVYWLVVIWLRVEVALWVVRRAGLPSSGAMRWFDSTSPPFGRY